MESKINRIGKKDIIWGVMDSSLRVGAGLILLPLIMHKMNSQTVAIWNVFTVITGLSAIFDLGFKQTFARIVSYIYCGVNKLQTSGFNSDERTSNLDYKLLSNTIGAMRWFYLRLSLLLFVFLASLGSLYIVKVLSSYNGNLSLIYIAWAILLINNTYNIYTLYFDSLLTGSGFVREAKQYSIIGQAVYLVVASGLILLGCDLVSVVSAQLLSIIMRRFLSSRCFYSNNMKEKLPVADNRESLKIIKTIGPNAIKLGLTDIGSFLINKSSVLLGTYFLSLEVMASYGVSMQVINFIAGLSIVFCQSYFPKVAKSLVDNNINTYKKLYLNSSLFCLVVFILGGTGFVLFSDFVVKLIESKTEFLPSVMLVTLLVFTFLAKNHSIAATFIMAKNEVPFFKASIISAIATVIFLYIVLRFTSYGIWGLIVAPGLVQLVYQNWRWPLMVINDIKQKRI